MYDSNLLNAAQSRFFKPRQGEELYDLANDPFEANNLAANPTYATNLAGLRTGLHQRVIGMPDLGILPVSVFIQEGGAADPGSYAQTNKQRIARYVGIADLMLDSYANVAPALQAHLASADPLERYWAITVGAALGTNASAMQPAVTTLITSETNALVLARAAVFLGQLGVATPSVERALKGAVLNCADKHDSLLVLNDAVHLQDTLGFNFTTISSSAIVGTSAWLTSRIAHLGW